jgi:hypothetical protein
MDQEVIFEPGVGGGKDLEIGTLANEIMKCRS